MEKVIYNYKDLGLASYLIVNGNNFVGVDVKYIKKFNEFKIFIKVEGYKEQLTSMRKYYDENKIKINKTKSVIDMISVLADNVERSLKNKEGVTPVSGSTTTL